MTSFGLFAFCTTLKKLNTLMANLLLRGDIRFLNMPCAYTIAPCNSTFAFLNVIPEASRSNSCTILITVSLQRKCMIYNKLLFTQLYMHIPFYFLSHSLYVECAKLHDILASHDLHQPPTARTDAWPLITYLPTVPEFPGLSRLLPVCPGVQICLQMSRVFRW